MRRGRSRTLRFRYAVLVVALLVITPWGSGALTRAKSAAQGVAVAVEGLGGDSSSEADRAKARPRRDRRQSAAELKGRRSPDRKPRAATATRWNVAGVVDGDTIDVVNAEGTAERVRLIGMDTPERGMCGYAEASNTLSVLVLHRDVLLSPGAVDDRDTYGRLLRYVDIDGVDAGGVLIEQGLAIARYDSRDGFGHHPREGTYVAADEGSPDVCPGGAAAPVPAAPAPAARSVGPAGGGAWPGCNEARAAGASPVYAGDPGYGSHLDGDSDGIGCE